MHRKVAIVVKKRHPSIFYIHHPVTLISAWRAIRIKDLPRRSHIVRNIETRACHYVAYQHYLHQQKKQLKRSLGPSIQIEGPIDRALNIDQLQSLEIERQYEQLQSPVLKLLGDF